MDIRKPSNLASNSAWSSLQWKVSYWKAMSVMMKGNVSDDQTPKTYRGFPAISSRGNWSHILPNALLKWISTVTYYMYNLPLFPLVNWGNHCVFIVHFINEEKKKIQGEISLSYWRRSETDLLRKKEDSGGREKEREKEKGRENRRKRRFYWSHRWEPKKKKSKKKKRRIFPP